MGRKWLAIAALCGATLLTARAPVLAGEPLPAGISEDAIKNAKTPEQHRAIADAYAREAKELRAKATGHRHMDSSYNEPGYLSQKLGFERHCRALARALETAADEADALADTHRAMTEREEKKAP